ncbi:MAG: spermidine/putrescine ABC transporter substrate-binding protein PotF, partial [Methylibium sp.]|nr:spermidine/putrescine ABC transporter substrate-binding protein PotF [Methylibium sp.]
MKLLSSRRAVGALGLVASVAAACSLLTSPAHAQEEKVLNVYNWSDYIAEDTVRNFEKET